MRLGTALFFAALTSFRIAAQPGPSFEAAATKISPFTGSGPIGIRTEGGRFIAQHVSVGDLVQYAYDVEAFQVSGGPGWFRSTDLFGKDRYEVLATAQGTPTSPQFRQMLQALLKE